MACLELLTDEPASLGGGEASGNALKLVEGEWGRPGKLYGSWGADGDEEEKEGRDDPVDSRVRRKRWALVRSISTRPIRSEILEGRAKRKLGL